MGPGLTELRSSLKISREIAVADAKRRKLMPRTKAEITAQRRRIRYWAEWVVWIVLCLWQFGLGVSGDHQTATNLQFLGAGYFLVVYIWIPFWKGLGVD